MRVGGVPPRLPGPRDARDMRQRAVRYTSPCAIIASATVMKPEMFAPAT